MSCCDEGMRYERACMQGGEMKESLKNWINEMLPLFLSQKLNKIEAELSEGKVTAYWAGSIIRIDIKPK